MRERKYITWLEEGVKSRLPREGRLLALERRIDDLLNTRARLMKVLSRLIQMSRR